MWGAIAAWIVCLASLSLPWPGIIIVALVCCLAFFELAGPTTRAAAKDGINRHASQEAKNWRAGIIKAPAAAIARAYQAIVGALHLRQGGAQLKEEGGSSEREPPAPSTPQRPLASFLKGTIGSFSRGGLMVTQGGRVIYKINQDRGLIAHPSLNKAHHTIFGIFDGHGENGEHVAAYVMREVPRRLASCNDAFFDPATALKSVFKDINASLPMSGINAVFGGTTAVVGLVRGSVIWVANAGDSRAVVVGRDPKGRGVVARALTWDQNPDTPGERERIESMGGFVSDPEEPGASARVWLDKTKTMVGLAMSRSIGDLAVKQVGVIAEPTVTEYEMAETDKFLIFASDGVWEFIENQEAAELVHALLDRGEDAAGACKGLMELANRRWSDMVGDYRDDITATVVLLPFLPPAAAAAAEAAAAAAKAEQLEKKALGAASSAGPADPGKDALLGSSSSSSSTSSSAKPAVAARLSAAVKPRSPVSAPSMPPPPACKRYSAREDPLVGPTATTSSKPVDPRGRSVEAPHSRRAVSAAEAIKGSPAGNNASHVAPAVTSRLGSIGATPLDSSLLNTVEGRDELGKAVFDEGTRSEYTLTPAVTPESTGGQGGREDDDDEGGDGDDEDEDEDEDSIRLFPAISDVYEPRPARLSACLQRRLTDCVENPGRGDEGGAARSGEAPGNAGDSKPGAQRGLACEGGISATGEEDEEDDEDWDLDFGARENREPSREMREASREFPASSSSVDPRETLLVASLERRRVVA